MLKNGIVSLKVASLAASMSFILSGCTPECVDQFDCAPKTGQRSACVSNACVYSNIPDAGTAGGSAGGGSAGGGAAGGSSAGGSAVGGGSAGGSEAGGGSAGGSAGGGMVDAGMVDAGMVDAGMMDAGMVDAGMVDAGMVDAGMMDAGMMDAGMMDAGMMDAGMMDAGMVDAGMVDAGMVDAGMVDAGMVDAGMVDAGMVDAGVSFAMDVLFVNNRLAAFQTNMPVSAVPSTITGTDGGMTLVAIDRRPRNGVLYALGVSALGDVAQLFTVNPLNFVAFPVGTASTFVDGAGAPILFGIPAATSFDIDFNPAVDRLRVTTSAGLNFRMNPNTGTLVDGDLGGASASVAGVNPDGNINGTGPRVEAGAYTNNNVANGSITTLYTLDALNDKVCISVPPNAGTQTQCLSLAPAVDSILGFDIPLGVNVNAANTTVDAGIGFTLARLANQGTESVCEVNLATGVLASVPFPVMGAVSMALNYSPAIPMVALSQDGLSLHRFDSATPGTVTTVTLSGIIANDVLVGIDFRPATGQLYGFAVNATTDSAKLYLIDSQTGAVSVVGGPIVAVDGGVIGDLPDAITGAYGVDFNPTVDRVRVVTSTGLNFRLVPATGLLAAVDGVINGGATGLDAVAYTNGHGDTVTTEYALDAISNSLFIVNPPNNGNATLGIAITLGGSPLDFTNASGFDIQRKVRVTASNAPPAQGLGYAALRVAGVTSLYAINLVTGAATNLGPIGTGVVNLAGIAVAD